ncbi:unnamed protein product, partial [Amoebophrya sp. A120]
EFKGRGGCLIGGKSPLHARGRVETIAECAEVCDLLGADTCSGFDTQYARCDPGSLKENSGDTCKVNNVGGFACASTCQLMQVNCYLHLRSSTNCVPLKALPFDFYDQCVHRVSSSTGAGTVDGTTTPSVPYDPVRTCFALKDSVTDTNAGLLGYTPNSDNSQFFWPYQPVAAGIESFVRDSANCGSVSNTDYTYLQIAIRRNAEVYPNWCMLLCNRMSKCTRIVQFLTEFKCILELEDADGSTCSAELQTLGLQDASGGIPPAALAADPNAKSLVSKANLESAFDEMFGKGKVEFINIEQISGSRSVISIPTTDPSLFAALSTGKSMNEQFMDMLVSKIGTAATASASNSLFTAACPTEALEQRLLTSSIELEIDASKTTSRSELAKFVRIALSSALSDPNVVQNNAQLRTMFESSNDVTVQIYGEAVPQTGSKTIKVEVRFTVPFLVGNTKLSELPVTADVVAAAVEVLEGGGAGAASSAAATADYKKAVASMTTMKQLLDKQSTLFSQQLPMRLESLGVDFPANPDPLFVPVAGVSETVELAPLTSMNAASGVAASGAGSAAQDAAGSASTTSSGGLATKKTFIRSKIELQLEMLPTILTDLEFKQMVQTALKKALSKEITTAKQEQAKELVAEAASSGSKMTTSELTSVVSSLYTEDATAKRETHSDTTSVNQIGTVGSDLVVSVIFDPKKSGFARDFSVVVQVTEPDFEGATKQDSEIVMKMLSKNPSRASNSEANLFAENFADEIDKEYVEKVKEKTGLTPLPGQDKIMSQDLSKSPVSQKAPAQLAPSVASKGSFDLGSSISITATNVNAVVSLIQNAVVIALRNAVGAELEADQVAVNLEPGSVLLLKAPVFTFEVPVLAKEVVYYLTTDSVATFGTFMDDALLTLATEAVFEADKISSGTAPSMATDPTKTTLLEQIKSLSATADGKLLTLLKDIAVKKNLAKTPAELAAFSKPADGSGVFKTKAAKKDTKSAATTANTEVSPVTQYVGFELQLAQRESNVPLTGKTLEEFVRKSTLASLKKLISVPATPLGNTFSAPSKEVIENLRESDIVVSVISAKGKSAAAGASATEVPFVLDSNPVPTTTTTTTTVSTASGQQQTTTVTATTTSKITEFVTVQIPFTGFSTGVPQDLMTVMTENSGKTIAKQVEVRLKQDYNIEFEEEAEIPAEKLPAKGLPATPAAEPSLGGGLVFLESSMQLTVENSLINVQAADSITPLTPKQLQDNRANRDLVESALPTMLREGILTGLQDTIGSTSEPDPLSVSLGGSELTKSQIAITISPPAEPPQKEEKREIKIVIHGAFPPAVSGKIQNALTVKDASKATTGEATSGLEAVSAVVPEVDTSNGADAGSRFRTLLLKSVDTQVKKAKEFVDKVSATGYTATPAEAELKTKLAPLVQLTTPAIATKGTAKPVSTTRTSLKFEFDFSSDSSSAIISQEQQNQEAQRILLEAKSEGKIVMEALVQAAVAKSLKKTAGLEITGSHIAVTLDKSKSSSDPTKGAMEFIVDVPYSTTAVTKMLSNSGGYRKKQFFDDFSQSLTNEISTNLNSGIGSANPNNTDPVTGAVLFTPLTVDDVLATSAASRKSYSSTGSGEPIVNSKAALNFKLKENTAGMTTESAKATKMATTSLKFKMIADPSGAKGKIPDTDTIIALSRAAVASSILKQLGITIAPSQIQAKIPTNLLNMDPAVTTDVEVSLSVVLPATRYSAAEQDKVLTAFSSSSTVNADTITDANGAVVVSETQAQKFAKNFFTEMKNYGVKNFEDPDPNNPSATPAVSVQTATAEESAAEPVTDAEKLIPEEKVPGNVAFFETTFSIVTADATTYTQTALEQMLRPAIANATTKTLFTDTITGAVTKTVKPEEVALSFLYNSPVISGSSAQARNFQVTLQITDVDTKKTGEILGTMSAGRKEIFNEMVSALPEDIQNKGVSGTPAAGSVEEKLLNLDLMQFTNPKAHYASQTQATLELTTVDTSATSMTDEIKASLAEAVKEALKDTGGPALQKEHIYTHVVTSTSTGKHLIEFSFPGVSKTGVTPLVSNSGGSSNDIFTTILK